MEAAVKKGKRIAMESSPPPASFYSVAPDARAHFRYQSLLMDYQDLLKETEAKKRHLQTEHQKKLKLLAEIKFLRKKYEGLLKNPSSKIYQVKKRPHTALPHLFYNSQPLEPSIQSQVSSRDDYPFCNEASLPSTSSAGIDLNRVSLPNDCEMEESQVNWDPLEVDKSKKRALEGGAFANDLKISIYQDVRKGSSRMKKKKIHGMIR